MKRFASLVLAGIAGGMIALGGAWLISTPDTVLPVEAAPTAQTVRHNWNSPPLATIPGSFSAAAQKAMPAVVHIAVSTETPVASRSDDPFRFFFGQSSPFGEAPRRGKGSGSGVIYTRDGYILTNNHVVDNATDIKVTLTDNRTFKATVVGTEPKADIAILKIEASDLPSLELADSDQIEIGDWVLAIGNPFELRSTITAGIISAKGRNIELLPGRDAIEAFLQTDAAVNPGNSGGALVDAQGRLVGINTAISSEMGVFAGYSFAIPINLARRIANDIMEYGAYQRPYLGISLYNLDSEAAATLGLDFSQGVVVSEVMEGGSAAAAGLQANDVIVQVDDKSILSASELQEAIGRSRVGDRLRVKIYRKGQPRNLTVELGVNPVTEN
jgi:Do/DeqQ family serine protease